MDINEGPLSRAADNIQKYNVGSCVETRISEHITKPELGCALITRDGQEFELKAQGWNPLKDEMTENAEAEKGEE